MHKILEKMSNLTGNAVFYCAAKLKIRAIWKSFNLFKLLFLFY